MPSNAVKNHNRNAPKKPGVCKKQPPPPPPVDALGVTFFEDTPNPHAHVTVIVNYTSTVQQNVHVHISMNVPPGAPTTFDYNDVTNRTQMFGASAKGATSATCTVTVTFNDGTVLTNTQTIPIT